MLHFGINKLVDFHSDIPRFYRFPKREVSLQKFGHQHYHRQKQYDCSHNAQVHDDVLGVIPERIEFRRVGCHVCEFKYLWVQVFGLKQFERDQFKQRIEKERNVLWVLHYDQCEVRYDRETPYKAE